MNLSQRQLIRIASDIRDQLLKLKQTKQREVQSKQTGLIEQMERLIKIRRKLNLCDIRNWQSTGEKVLKQAESALRDIPFHIQQTEQAIQACNIAVPSVAEVYRELIQADEEFDNLVFHKQGDLLGVTTDAIELNDVYLGEFEIQLHLPSLAEMRYNNIYRIYAMDPHPASSNDCVTHPHVSDERLCAGDAGAAINMALTAGRICDFFLLVRSVLTNYNPESPYVALDSWFGTACYECGYVTGSDETCWCDCCEHEYCCECSSYCRRCDESTCLSCLDKCPACDDLVCPNCKSVCPECGEQLCQNCLDDMACPCIEENKENENDESKNEENEEAANVTRIDTNEKRDGNFNVACQTPGPAEGVIEKILGIDAA